MSRQDPYSIDQNLSNLMYKHGKDLDEAIEKLRKDLLRCQADTLLEKISNEGRCPKCTLRPPCKHYSSASEIPSQSKTRRTSPIFQPSTPSSVKSQNNSTNSIAQTFKVRYRGRSKESPKSTSPIDEFQKLKIMEKLEKYKEEKLQQEIQHIEDLKKTEEIVSEQEKVEEKKRELYYCRQKNKLLDYKKNLKARVELLVQRKMTEDLKEKLNQARYLKLLEEKKQKLAEYHLKKQVIEGITNQSIQESVQVKKSPTKKKLKSLKLLRINRTYL